MVLEQGRIIERGSHDDLIEKKGKLIICYKYEYITKYKLYLNLIKNKGVPFKKNGGNNVK
ncbi:hypothetical protein ACH36K_09245 [Clostridium sp. MB05]|jgi:hypothetical protein|uniref:hypothetical protein n=1 Tax=Clostridium TaxID=1485 RepID=UPI002ACC317E|nr:hypothetical protein [Clostridium perfringens]